jgi:hypothetical protein
MGGMQSTKLCVALPSRSCCAKDRVRSHFARMGSGRSVAMKELNWHRVTCGADHATKISQGRTKSGAVGKQIELTVRHANSKTRRSISRSTVLVKQRLISVSTRLYSSLVGA